ncbi:unnamed protein product, partial [marine sediment metagenome]
MSSEKKVKKYRIGDNREVILLFHPENEEEEVLRIEILKNKNQDGDFYEVILGLDNQPDGTHNVLRAKIDKNAIESGESYNSVKVEIPHNSNNDEYILKWHSHDENDEIIARQSVWGHERINEFVTQ